MIFCSQCGKQLPDDAKFCDGCGTKTGVETPAVNAPETMVAPIPTAQTSAKLKWKLIIPIAAVVVIIAAVITLAATGVFGGGNSYKKADGKFVDNLINTIGNSGASAGGTYDFSLSYEMSSALANLINLDISKIGLDTSVVSDGKAVSANISASIGDETLPDILAAFDGDRLTVSSSKISDYYISVLLSDLGGGSANTTDLPALDMKKLKNTLSNITDTYFKLADKNSTSSNDTLSGGGIDIKCKKYVISFTEDFANEFATSAISEIRKNQNLMDYLDAVLNSADSSESIDEILNDASNEISNSAGGSDIVMKMTVYVAGGKVIGREIKDVQSNSFSLSYKQLVKGSNMYISADVSSEGSNVLSLTANMTKGGKGWSGTPQFTVSDGYTSPISAEVDITDMNYAGGFLTGTLAFNDNIDASGVPVPVNLTLTFSKDGSKQTAALTGSVLGYNIGTLTMGYAYASGGKVNIPKLDAGKAVDPNDYSSAAQDNMNSLENDIENYLEGTDFYNTLQNFISNLF